ncbi:glucosaminidase domain-containing protein [Pseudomonadota bacterium]
MNKTLAFIFPLALALLLAGFIPAKKETSRVGVDERLQLTLYQVDSAHELQKVFDDIGYHWPPQVDGLIPAIEIASFPPDLAQLESVKQKKALFFGALLPIVLAENESLLDLRIHLKRLLDKGYSRLNDGERRWVDVIAKRYRVRGSIEEGKVQRSLLARIDMIPAALILAQAANESAWGTSRFAQQGNNLFGQWTFNQSEGIVPLGRPEGETYAVRAFSSLDASVRAYLHNLNTNAAYAELRKLRRGMRDSGQALDAHVLATGLQAYSERGDAYIEEIQAMMRVNKLIHLLHSVALDRNAKKLSSLLPVVSTAG